MKGYKRLTERYIEEEGDFFQKRNQINFEKCV